MKKLTLTKTLLKRLYQSVLESMENAKDDKKIEELQQLELILSKYL